MKRYIYAILVLAIFAVSCKKGEKDWCPPPTPLPYLPITCSYDGKVYDDTEAVVLNSDGAELLFEIKDECASAYFRCYQYWLDDKMNRVLVQYHNYEGIDNYECDLFELKQIDEYHFSVRILPSERDLRIEFDFNPHEYAYSWSRLTVVVNGK